MAKAAKKETALTPEEKLAHALVSNTEYPFKIPANWCWTKIGVFSSLYRGVSYKKNDAHSEKHENDCLVLRGGNIGEGFIDTESDNVYVDMSFVNKNQLVRKNDIIVVASTGSTKVIGRAGISEADYSDVAFGAFLILVRPNESMVPKYMGLFFQSDLYRNRIRNSVSGININNIRSEYITESPYPFPPLAEQQRIVDRIESLFAKLDEAKEKAQAVVDNFEDRKAAILHKAFTGELTEKWREKRGLNLSDWRKMQIKQIGEIITGSTPSTTNREYYGGSIPFVKPPELNQGRHVTFSENTLTEAGKAVSRPIRAGATCICCIGATISKCGFLDVDSVTNQQINSIIPYEFMDDVFVYYYCCSKEFKDALIDNSSSTTLPIINKSKMSALSIVVPSKCEQIVISAILDNTFSAEQNAKDAAEQVIDRIETMKKSILARAFRGELGTNDPNDESAIELLKRILE